MKHHLKIDTIELRNRAVTIANSMPLDDIHEIIIRPWKRDRSAEQNSYYWKILTVIGNDLGNTKDEQHCIYKRMFLVPIFTRDDSEYAEMIGAIDAMRKQHLGLVCDVLDREIVKLTSTTQANVKQMSEYIDDIQNHATSLGIRLPGPEYK